MQAAVTYYSSPAGIIEITGTGAGIESVLFCSNKGEDSGQSAVVEQCKIQLEEYFAGSRKTFDLPLAPNGTDFQKRVWNELLNIPYGKVVSYLDMARRLGDEKTIRAAASANGKNPIGIIIPCHRVIGANGDLTGYAGGLDKKRLLLELEGSIGKGLF
ncbi:MAG TPA: methylated-DNA--[protein]-cysteine S-methyltransferase [Bacteroidia bacterium]|nr:methylated-DNA--[protein]-cysteine S-methyltransferase [Bacteroidia bacterium]